MRRRPAFALIALGLAPLAGCGGGGATETSHDAWAGKADAICRSTEAKTSPLTARLEELVRTGIRTPAERADAAATMRKGMPALAYEIAGLRHLRPPVADQPPAAGLLRAFEEKRLLTRDLIHAFEHGSATEINRVLLRLERSEAGERRFARRLGLRACGSNATGD